MKLNYKRVFFVGLAFFLINAFWQAYDTIIPKILTDKFGMSQTLSGAVMAVDNVLALFLLPLFGSISDRCKSRLGRRTPFILVGTIIAAVFLVGLSFADAFQLRNLSAVAPDNPSALTTLYDANLTVTTPEGETVAIQSAFTREEYAAITVKNADGSASADYTAYVAPARQVYAAAATARDGRPLALFIALLLVVLLSMAVFRSPAVALMPDVTPKPLRSKANAVINLMGAAGYIAVLACGMAFGTGRAENALMSYTGFFSCVAGIMLLALLVFMLKVREPRLVAQMEEETRLMGGEELPPETGAEKRALQKDERRSLLLILASVALWYMGYNAVTSKYSVYAQNVLMIDYNMTLTVASVASVVTYIPVGIISSRVGRKKTILAGVIILAASFLLASFMRTGSSVVVMNILFATCGVGWATINVNSYPMVVELAGGSDVGKYTGFYYTASMAAQTVTPILSGVFLDIKMTTLFPYAFVFVALAFVTMLFVRHGDNKPAARRGLDALDVDM